MSSQWQFFKLLLTKADLFKSPVPLLFKRQQFGSFCGGVASLVLLALLFVIFLPTFQTFFSFKKYSITISEVYTTPEPLTTLDQNQFSLSVMLLGYNHSKRMYDVFFTFSEILVDSNGTTTRRQERLQGVPCNLSSWAAPFGNAVLQSMQSYQDQMAGPLICSPPELNMSMAGRYSSNMSSFHVTIERCLSPDCLTDEEVAREGNIAFYPEVFFPQPSFDYYSETPMTLVLQEQLWYYSQSKRPNRRAFQILISDVVVDDQNADIWPSAIPLFHNYSNIKKGFMIDMMYETGDIGENVLACWRFRKSSKTKLVERTIQKADELLSYVGGCLGVLLVIGEIIRSYNQKLMLLQLSANIKFQAGFEQEKPIYQSFSFLTFLKLAGRECCRLLARAEDQQLLSESVESLNELEKAEFVIDYSEDILSIDSLFCRLKKCEVLIECLAGQNSMSVVSVRSQSARDLVRRQNFTRLLDMNREDGQSHCRTVDLIYKKVRQQVQLELARRNKWYHPRQNLQDLQEDDYHQQSQQLFDKLNSLV